MNFDTYKIKDELLEIYSGSEETFCVGKILSQNRDSILFRSYDAQGKNDGLHFIKSSHISEIKSNTQYLRKMQLYLAYWREQEDAPLTNPFKKHGSLGAMVYGGVPEEKITLNYDTFWSGPGHREEKEVSTDTLEYARKLLFEEKFWEAEQYMKENMLGFYNESYMPLGILNYEFEKIEEPQEYVRSLQKLKRMKLFIHLECLYQIRQKHL